MLPRFRSMKVVTGVSELPITRCDLLRRLSFPKALTDFSPGHTKQRNTEKSFHWNAEKY